MRRSLAEECEAQERHAAFLQHYARPDPDSMPPAPGYFDCARCPLRAQADDEGERRSICRSCDWDELPAAPTLQFLFAESMAAFPDYVLAKCEDLTDQQHIDIAFVRRYWEERREMNRVKLLAQLFGGVRA